MRMSSNSAGSLCVGRSVETFDVDGIDCGICDGVPCRRVEGDPTIYFSRPPPPNWSNRPIALSDPARHPDPRSLDPSLRRRFVPNPP